MRTYHEVGFLLALSLTAVVSASSPFADLVRSIHAKVDDCTSVTNALDSIGN
jgi:hypothetical protein